MDEAAKQFNPAQKKAITYGQGPLLVVAGAGTGKTTVITQRLAWLIDQKLAKPDEILALTFTDKAAEEMEERIDILLPYGYLDLWVHTFHAFCERILKNHGLEIGLSNDFKLLTQTETWLLMRENLDKFNLDYYRPLGNPTKFIHALIKHFSRCKDELISPQEYLAYAEKLTLDSDAVFSSEDIFLDTKKSLAEIANAYHTYNQILLDNNALDFGDLINYAVKLFKERPKILGAHRRQFKYILVDEFQDTNLAQYELIKLLAAPQNNLTVVGDDDQCLPGYVLIDTPNGRKPIMQFRKGDKIITAVGKGHLGVSYISHIFKSTKKAKIITITTKKGLKIQVTDNHKMFCYVPSVSNKKTFYVYLMRRHDSDWRLGITNDLATRLRLERSADSILALRAFSTEIEARYFETFWSLKYGIPTACFKLRENIVIQGKWSIKLYKELAIKKNVQKLAEDLNIDLSAFHVCLNGVRRGQSTRIKINVQMCYRRYRSKQHVRSGKELLYKETIAHLVYLETSDRKTIAKLKKAKFKIQKAKKGWRYRFASSDTNKIGQVAETLRWLTGGIIEYKFFAGRFKHQSLPALIIPAKNLVKGLYLPVRRGREIFYDEISNIKINQKKMTVYDLEVEKTHNFVANGIVVHNSIYKFRGASISNILHFKNDYPEAELVTLAENYRSAQNILDKAYSLIVNNNPDRLEEKLKISKKLSAKDQAAGVGLIEEITGRSGEEEARLVAEKILELKAEDEKRGDSSWNDFAILIRSNAEADDFILTLERRGVPYQFLASRGLYRAAIVLDIVSYLKLLDNYHENQAAFRVLNLPLWEIATEDIVKMTHLAKKKSHSLFEILKQCRATGVSEKSAQKIDNLLSLIGKHAESARRVSVAKIIYAFLNDSGYLRDLVKRNDKGEGEARRQIMFLKQFYDYVSRFETSREEKLVKHFLEHFNFVLESGEEGSLEQDFESGPEAVKIMTAHSAKGLEFRYVFIVNLVEMRFPSIGRSDPIELPEGLIKEILPEGDSHLQEERRLFYVAMTRAKEGIFFAHADSYGGSRKRKPSRFLGEIQLGVSAPTAAEDEIAILPPPPASFASASAISAPPAHFSYTQLKAFETCPCQYRFAHILHIPVQGSAGFSFGKTMHLALQRFYGQIINLNSANQGDLFAPAPAEAASASGSEGKIKAPSLETLLSFYEEAWIEDWYRDQKQKEEYRAKGRRALKEFYEKAEWTVPKFLEAGFHLEIGGFKLRGQIDRIDSLPDGSVEVIDYKTGNPKKEDKLNLDDKEQLLIYQLAVQEALGERPSLLSFYYLDDNTKVSFLGKKEELEKIKLKIVRNIEAIQKFDFPPNPSPHNCGYCDFKFICEQARL